MEWSYRIWGEIEGRDGDGEEVRSIEVVWGKKDREMSAYDVSDVFLFQLSRSQRSHRIKLSTFVRKKLQV